MKTKNKMKDSMVEFEEWWHVAKEYFTKQLEKNLTHHKVDERILKYKLEAYQKNFPDFIYGSLTRTKVLGQDEERKAGPPSGTIQEEEMKIKEPHDLKSGATQEEEVEPKKPQDFRGKGQEEK